MKIAIGADHGGFEMKAAVIEVLKANGIGFEDMGCYSAESVDYPDYAETVCDKVKKGDADRGILICGTGIGMSLAANKHLEIRAALCHDEYTARMSREHNNANILCLGARVIGGGVAEAIVDVWLRTEFSGGRHLKRISKFSS